jgi:DNA-directed RNA polymerase subunit RPC12/RpoP
MTNARQEHEFDDLDDDAFDDEGSELASDTIRCAQCGVSIYEDAVRCPHCGWYVTPDTSPWSGRPFWWILLALAGIAALIVMLLQLG